VFGKSIENLGLFSGSPGAPVPSGPGVLAKRPIGPGMVIATPGMVIAKLVMCKVKADLFNFAGDVDIVADLNGYRACSDHAG
jgi:hypothetical protein